MLAAVTVTVRGLILTAIPPMPDIDQIQTDEEWNAMMEEYEAVQLLRGKILRGEVVLGADGSVPGAAEALAAVPAAPVAAAALPVAPVAAVAVPAAVAAAVPVPGAPAAAFALPNPNDPVWMAQMAAYQAALAAQGGAPAAVPVA